VPDTFPAVDTLILASKERWPDDRSDRLLKPTSLKRFMIITSRVFGSLYTA